MHTDVHTFTYFLVLCLHTLAREGSVAEMANRTLCALVCTGTFNATRSMEQGVPLRPHLPCLPAHRINRLVCPCRSQAWIAAFCVAALAAARCPAEERRMQIRGFRRFPWSGQARAITLGVESGADSLSLVG